MNLRQRVRQLEQRTAHLPRQVDLPPVETLSEKERQSLSHFANVVQKVLAECHSRSGQVQTGKLLIRLLYENDETRRRLLDISDEQGARFSQD